MKRIIATFVIGLSVATAVAQPQVVEAAEDSVEVVTGHEDTRFNAKQLILPGALVAVGAFGVDNGWFCSLKQDVKKGFQDWRGDKRFHADDKLQYLPVIANVGLGLTGIKSRHPFRERVAATATAYAALGALVNVTKYTVKEKRPDTNARNSFPSGHTATAFMGAELVREEYGNAWGAGAYAFATGIAFLRLYNDRHWLNDVIGGAGVGMLSARIGYWLLPWERHLLGWDKKDAAMVLVPSYNPELHAPTLCFAASF